MSYFDQLNNAELFALYAQGRSSRWDKIVGRVVTHINHGNGTVVEKDGFVLQVHFADEVRFFCELDFLASQLTRAVFTNISFPPKMDRESLIETLYCWNAEQKRLLGSDRGLRQSINQSELAYQRGLAQRKYIKLQKQMEPIVPDPNAALIQDIRSKKSEIHDYMKHEAQANRDG